MMPSELGCVVIDRIVLQQAVSFRSTQAAQPGARAAGPSGQKDRPEPAAILRAFARSIRTAAVPGPAWRRQLGRKVYSLHAPEVEYIGKGKTHRPLRVRSQG